MADGVILSPNDNIVSTFLFLGEGRGPVPSQKLWRSLKNRARLDPGLRRGTSYSSCLPGEGA